MSLAIPSLMRLYKMQELTEMVLAYELTTACVALESRIDRIDRVSERVQEVYALVREVVEPLTEDRSPGPDVEKVMAILNKVKQLAL